MPQRSSVLQRRVVGASVFLVVVVAAAVSPPRACDAAVVTDFYSFAGTTIDSSAWRTFGPGAITQNNGVTIDTFGGSRAELTSRFTLEVGMTVRVPVTITRANYPISGAVYLMLRSDSAPTNTWNFDDGWFGLSNTSSSMNTNAGRFPSGYGFTVRSPELPLGETFLWEIARTGPLSAEYRVFDASGANLLGSYLDNSVGQAMTPRPNLPPQMHLALYTQQATATFSNVSIVPEPAVLPPLAVGAVAAAGLCGRARRRRRRVPRPRGPGTTGHH